MTFADEDSEPGTGKQEPEKEEGKKVELESSPPASTADGLERHPSPLPASNSNSSSGSSLSSGPEIAKLRSGSSNSDTIQRILSTDALAQTAFLNAHPEWSVEYPPTLANANVEGVDVGTGLGAAAASFSGSVSGSRARADKLKDEKKSGNESVSVSSDSGSESWSKSDGGKRGDGSGDEARSGHDHDDDASMHVLRDYKLDSLD